MSKETQDVKSMNIYTKLLKIADMAGVLRKNKAGYNYSYVTEDEIQAKITAGMQKYNIMLLPNIRPDTLKVSPVYYQKFDKKLKQTIDVNEVVVACEVEYIWVNADKPEEIVKCGWAYIGQMEDASQAFGAGATYGNRYYLMKALQMATIEDDPDNYRSKQKQAENYEEEQRIKEEKKALEKEISIISDLGKTLINAGVPKEKIVEIVANLNDGNGNPNSIKSIEIAQAVEGKFKELKQAIKTQKGDEK